MEYGLKNAFRFYDKKDKQNRYREYVHGNIKTWMHATDTTHIPSFQLSVANGTVIGGVTVYLASLDDSEVNITSYFDTAGTDADLYVQSFPNDSLTYLIHNNYQAITGSIPQGTYYLRVLVGATSYYSEVFKVVGTTGWLSVEYYHKTDLDSIDYTQGSDHVQYTNKLLINTKLTKPEWEFTEEGVEDGNGEFLYTIRKSKKVRKFMFYAPEYVLDALHLIPLHSNITVTTELGRDISESISAVEFDVSEVSWSDLKGFAKVTCSVYTDPVIVTRYDNNLS